MAKVVLSVGANVAALRCSGGGGGALRLRLLLPPTSSSSSSCLRVITTTTTTTTTTHNYPSYHTLPTLGLGLNPGRGLVAPISETQHHHRRRGRSSIRASSTHHHHVNDSGSIDSPLINSMQTKIKEQLNAESVIVKDAYGDGRHVSIDVVSSVFEGESAVSRQRMVYKAIWEELQNTVHAVDQMTTKTPSEVATNK